MAKIYDVVAITGEYTNSSGETKKRYANIGAIIEGRNGPQLKLESVPLGWNGWAYLNEPQARDQQRSRGPSGPSRSAFAGKQEQEESDDIPF